jgi:hypothetical protein
MASRSDALRTWYGNLTFRARAAVAVVCVLALAGAGYGVAVFVGAARDSACMRRDATVVTHEGPHGECVGITDGAYHFDDRLAGIEEKIRAENRAIVKEHPKAYVSVVLLLPISSDSSSIMSIANAAEQMEGAFTAQHSANQARKTPYIQLLLGSDGYQANEWRPAVAAIEASDSHVAAVTGLGISLDTTENAIAALTRHQIPVIGATLTSDRYDRITNFVRVSPSNREGARMVLPYFQHRYQKAILISDVYAGDSYATSLTQGFQQFEGPHVSNTFVTKLEYTTKLRDAPGQSQEERQQHDASVAGDLDRIEGKVCELEQSADPVVLFAGRGRELAAFLHSLANQCPGKRITIVSGDDVTNMPMSKDLSKDLSKDVTVDYAGVAHPQEWRSACPADQSPPCPSPAPDANATRKDLTDGEQGYAAFDAAFQSNGVAHHVDLVDGNAMMAYDATLTALRLVQLTRMDQPQANDVTTKIPALRGDQTVYGASGLIRFPNESASGPDSNPVHKPTPILELRKSSGAAKSGGYVSIMPKVIKLVWPKADSR